VGGHQFVVLREAAAATASNADVQQQQIIVRATPNKLVSN
jgi:hypothetical protein